MAVDKKFFVDINLQGNALNNATIGSNSDMTKGGSFQYDAGTARLEYFDGSNVHSVANLSDISAVTGGLILQGGYNAATETPNITGGSALKGFFWVVTEAGSFLGTSVQVGDSLVATVDNAGASIGDWLILQGNVVIATDSVDGIVRLATQAEVDAGTEGGAVVLTPATFESSSQLSDIRSDISALETDKLNLSGGTMSGSIDMGGSTISQVVLSIASLANPLSANGQAIFNLPTPTDGGDAANKTYVDDQAAAAETAANSYTDGQIATVNNDKLSRDGSLDMTGNLDMGTFKITKLAAPENNGDATNKIYVDTAASTAQSNAEATASADATTKANAAQAAAESYADGLSVNYDAAGSAATAQTNAETFATNAANTAQQNAEGYAKTYADSLAPNYDAAGSATQALTDANVYTDSAISQEVTDRNSAIATAKGEAIADSNSYTDGAIAQEVIDRDAAIATAKSEAIADANAYTDTQIAAQSFSSSFADTDWTLSGGVYTLSVAHSVSTSTPKVASYVSGNLVEFAVVVIDANTIELKSNIAAPASVSVGVSK